MSQLINDEQKIVDALLEGSTDTAFWYYIKPGTRPHKKTANKFFFSSILDYQMKAETVWATAQSFIEDVLGDPEDLWETITSYKLAKVDEAHP